MEDIKYLTKNFTIASGTSGTQRPSLELTKGFKNCIGIAFIEKTNGGNTTYKIGFSDDTKQYVDPIPKVLLESDKGFKIEDRFMPVLIPANGNRVYVDVALPNTTASTMEFDVVFKLK